jgi:hypothetical protein
MSPNKGLLKFAIALCLIFALSRLVEFIYIHIPPHKVGECFVIPGVTGLTAKIIHNFPIDGFSDVEMTFTYRQSTITDTALATFTEQRQDFGEKTTCL